MSKTLQDLNNNYPICGQKVVIRNFTELESMTDIDYIVHECGDSLREHPNFVEFHECNIYLIEAGQDCVLYITVMTPEEEQEEVGVKKEKPQAEEKIGIPEEQLALMCPEELAEYNKTMDCEHTTLMKAKEGSAKPFEMDVNFGGCIVCEDMCMTGHEGMRRMLSGGKIEMREK
jgi:hypothetical protein